MITDDCKQIIIITEINNRSVVGPALSTLSSLVQLRASQGDSVLGPLATGTGEAFEITQLPP